MKRGFRFPRRFEPIRTETMDLAIIPPLHKHSQIIQYYTKRKKSLFKMAEEKSPDDDDMTPDERVSWLRDRVSFNVLLLI